ncbi:MAG: hypothetical protein R3342_11610 [Lutibacter sp.]|uniref:hypothetical protein n=1 Tax=Lutibacter sp. TaxID=1925666 RepID=UPI00299DAD82|nr:hypothetical protein [Lutibacter sp.]MDX1830179.1 hypothetical protein [Lutibacter sp.]
MKVKLTEKLKTNKYLYIISILFFVINITNAQTQLIKLNGTVKNDSIKLQDINIKNITSNLGTTSDKNGHFTIYAKKGDSILFSSIVYENRIIKISDTHINSKTIIVYLEPDFYQLDEVMLDNSFKLDVTNVPVTRGTIFNNDEVSHRKPPNARKLSDPNANAGGLNPIALFMAITKKSRLRRKAKKLKEQKIKLLKQEFPTTIRNQYGDEFYTKWLSIPKDKINLFLDYCQANGLDNFYFSNEFVIKDFLIKQAVKFNSLKN